MASTTPTADASTSASVTLANLKAALAGESMAHIKYRYFARLCRAAGDEETAKLFEDTADQEILHAWGHLDLLLLAMSLTPAKCLELAIEGETHEYTEMYPAFRVAAEAEGHNDAVREIDEQIAESKEHAALFGAVLAKAARRFAALTGVEKRHAGHYQARLDQVTA
jgi:rubrerythrin